MNQSASAIYEVQRSQMHIFSYRIAFFTILFLSKYNTSTELIHRFEKRLKNESFVKYYYPSL